MKKIGVVTCKSPSNIALVKYWGKKPVQIPANPSISFSLTNCTTETSISLEESQGIVEDFNFSFEFEGQLKPEFHEKIEQFLSRVKDFIPQCLNYKMIIHSKNTFPHSSGIASSASSMSALAGCLYEWERLLTDGSKDESYFRNISEMARLGSGSAARSIAGGYSFWGKYNNMPESSDHYAVQVKNIHENFIDIQDTILLVDQGVKEVSSTVGHNLMNNHPFAEQRFLQAHDNITKLLEILSDGSFMDFANLVEQEALSLHAMMLSSNPSFILFKPNTIHIIEEIRSERKRSGLEICFTLDAGANVHVLYPKRVINSALAFIEEKLVGFCENGAYICDEVGEGQEIITKLNA